jgi:hypothetical protein
MNGETESFPKKESRVVQTALYVAVVMLSIAGIVVWVWSPILGAYFYADDFLFLLGTQTPGVVRASLVPPGAALVWVYRPLAGFGYYWIIRSLFGLNPVAFQLTSLAVHLLNASLVTWLIFRFGCSRRASLFVGLLYAAHISHLGGLVWAATFQEVLATFLIFSALAAYLRTESSRCSNEPRPVLAMVCFGAALLSKESAFSFPLLLTWFETIRPSSLSAPSSFWMRYRRVFPFYVIAGIYGMIFYVTHAFPRGEGYTLGIGLFVFRHLQQYLWWALEPTLWGLAYESNLVIILFAALLITLRRHWQVWLGSGWILIALFPVLFLPSRVSAHYLMIGLLGVCLVVAVGIDQALAMASRWVPRLAPHVGVIVLGYVLLSSSAKARSHNQHEIQAGWIGRVQRVARCVASHVLTRYPAGLPAKTVIFRDFDEHAKWSLWDGAILNVLYQDSSIKSIFVPDLRPGPANWFFSWTGGDPEKVSHLTIARWDISSCEGASVSLSANPPSLQVVNNPVAWTANAIEVVAPQYRFWVQAQGGPFILAQDYGPSSTFIWRPSVEGAYVVCVWVRRTGSAADKETDTCAQFRAERRVSP